MFVYMAVCMGKTNWDFCGGKQSVNVECQGYYSTNFDDIHLLFDKLMQIFERVGRRDCF